MKKLGRPKKIKDCTVITVYIGNKELDFINTFCDTKGIVRGRFMIESTLHYIKQNAESEIK